MTAAPHSGSAATARMVSLLGAALPRSPVPWAEDQERGRWGESQPIDALHKDLLESAGSAWDDVSPFPASWHASPIAEQYRTRMAGVVAGEYEDADLFVVQDPRISRIAPFWVSVLEQLGVRPAFIHPIRNPLEVAAALADSQGISTSNGILLWLRYVLEAERATRNHPRAFVSFDDLLRDWRSSARTIAGDIGLAWPRSGRGAEAELERFIAPGRRHHVFSIGDLDARPHIVRWVKDAHAVLLDACRSGNEPDRTALDELSAALASADLAYGPVVADARAEIAEVRRTLNAERALVDSELDQLRMEREGTRVAAAAATQAHEERLIELRRERNELIAELNDLRDRFAEAETENATRAENLWGQIDSTTTEVERLTKEVEVLTKERESRSFALRAANSERELLQRERAALEAAADDLRAQVRGLEARRGVLEAEVMWRKARRRRRSVSQLLSWVFNPFSSGRPRMARELITLRRSAEFDAAFYLSRYRSVAKAGMNPLMHYIEHGAAAGLDPSASFSTKRYVDAYPELRGSGVNPLYHYVKSQAGTGS